MILSIKIKQLFATALLLCMCMCIYSCSEESGEGAGKGGAIDKETLVGEWKAIEIEATFLNGQVVTITDPDEIKDELENMAWIDVTENYIRPMNYRHVVLIPYEITDKYLIFDGGESDANYEIQSVTQNELIIKYIGAWTSYITYKKVTKEPVDKKKFVGEWKATHINSYGYESTDEDKIKRELQGLEWVTLTDNTLTMMNTGTLLSYSVKNNYLIITSPSTQLSFAIESVTENKIIVNSTFALITYSRVQKKDYKISGKAEKGPFIRNSAISLETLNSKLSSSGKVYTTETTDNFGSFSLECKGLSDTYVELKANGYFFNELQNTLSNSTFTLKALADLNNSSNVNINILTHIKSARIKNLVSLGMNFSDASKQAQYELLDIFALNSVIQKDVEAISIADGSEEAAALLAVSSLLLMNRSEAELTEYLATINSFFGENGYFPIEIQESIEEDKNKLARYISDIKNNVIGRYKSQGKHISVKNLSYYIDWNCDGIAGNEILKDNETIDVFPAVIDVPNEGGDYIVDIISPIPVFLEPQVASESDNAIITTPTTTPNNGTRVSSAESLSDATINYECELYDNTLYINVYQNEANVNKNEIINIYDYIGNVVATVELRQEAMKQRIDFSIFIENSTRTIESGYTDVSKIPGFKVYGTKYENGDKVNLFNGTEIVNSGNNKWEYKYEDDVKYWSPCAEYSFAAVVNATSVTTDQNSGTPEVIHFTSDGETDLLYANNTWARTNEYAQPVEGVTSYMCVPFNFTHLLSKLEIEFTNKANLYYKVSNIKVVNVYAKGEYSVSTKEWKNVGTETIDINFGNATNSTSENAAADYIKNGETIASNYSRLLIPSEQGIIITYDFEMSYGENNVVQKGNKSYNIMISLKAGSSYKMRIGLQNQGDDYIEVITKTGWKDNDITTR